MINYSLAQAEDMERITRLLQVNNLPYSDIKESPVEFIVAKTGDDLIGCIGLEQYGREGLLRSFAVEPHLQNKGIGKELYTRLLHHASNNNIKTLHLLTDTARDYFAKMGFSHTDRNQAPDAISRSSEFAGLCPVSSTYMILDTISEYAG